MLTFIFQDLKTFTLKKYKLKFKSESNQSLFEKLRIKEVI